MDLIKIGKYIAFKRKEQGLTQKQLAEKENVDIKKVQLVQKKLKKAKKIKYVGVGKNGHWEWNDN